MTYHRQAKGAVLIFTLVILLLSMIGVQCITQTLLMTKKYSLNHERRFLYQNDLDIETFRQVEHIGSMADELWKALDEVPAFSLPSKREDIDAHVFITENTCVEPNIIKNLQWVCALLIVEGKRPYDKFKTIARLLLAKPRETQNFIIPDNSISNQKKHHSDRKITPIFGELAYELKEKFELTSKEITATTQSVSIYQVTSQISQKRWWLVKFQNGHSFISFPRLESVLDQWMEDSRSYLFKEHDGINQLKTNFWVFDDSNIENMVLHGLGQESYLGITTKDNKGEISNTQYFWFKNTEFDFQIIETLDAQLRTLSIL